MNPFQGAMLVATMEDARSAPCLLCGDPPATVGVWEPSREYARRLGVAAGKTRLAVYSLCRRCSSSPGVTRRVERHYLRQAEAKRAALAAGLEVHDNLVTRPGQPAPDWVREALDAFEEQAGRAAVTGAVFAWQDGPPRAVHVRTAGGETFVLCEPGAEPPDPPACFAPPPRRRPPAPADRRRRRRRPRR